MKHIDDELISFETAKLARKKGFNIETTKRYLFRYKEHESKDYIAPLASNPLHCDILAPTQSLLQKWLREEHNTHIWVSCTPYLNSYSFNYNLNRKIIRDNVKYNEYEKALEYGLFKALNLI